MTELPTLSKTRLPPPTTEMLPMMEKLELVIVREVEEGMSTLPRTVKLGKLMLIATQRP